MKRALRQQRTIFHYPYLLYHIKGYFEKIEKNDIQQMLRFVFVDVDKIAVGQEKFTGGCKIWT